MGWQVQARREERELLISGRRDAPKRSEDQKQYRCRVERRFGNFSRTFTVRLSSDITPLRVSILHLEAELLVHLKGEARP